MEQTNKQICPKNHLQNQIKSNIVMVVIAINRFIYLSRNEKKNIQGNIQQQQQQQNERKP